MPKRQTTKTPDPLTAGLDLDDPSAWVSADQLPVLYPALWPRPFTLRWDLRHRDTNGLGRFVRVIARKTILHRDGAARWKLAQATMTDPRWASR